MSPVMHRLVAGGLVMLYSGIAILGHGLHSLQVCQESRCRRQCQATTRQGDGLRRSRHDCSSCCGHRPVRPGVEVLHPTGRMSGPSYQNDAPYWVGCSDSHDRSKCSVCGLLAQLKTASTAFLEVPLFLVPVVELPIHYDRVHVSAAVHVGEIRGPPTNIA